MHGWVTGPRSTAKAVPYWEGAHSIPRVVELKGDRLWQEPIPELKVLRGKHHTAADQVKGDALEMIATFVPGDAKTFGVKLRVSDDGRQFTRVYFDTASGTFGVDGQALKRHPQQSYVKSGNPVTLHIFLDRSIVEVYVNGAAQTARTFPEAGSLGIEVFSEGGKAELKTLDVWEMKSMWE